MARILITGARAPVALDLMRQMAQARHSVWLADSIRYPAAAFSHHAEAYIRTPPPRDDPKGFIAALGDIMREKKIDLLIPTCEEIFYISRYRQSFDNPDAVFCSDFDLLKRLHNKLSFAANIVHPDVKAPETFPLETPADVKIFTDQSREYVFKPVYSRFATRTLIRPTPDKLEELIPRPGDLWIAQRFIAGTEFCSYGVAKNGLLLAHALYHPLYRLGQSSSYYFHPEENVKIENFVRDFVATSKFTGQISFDYIRQADGNIFVLECNPRAISGLHLFGTNKKFPAAFWEKSDGLIKPIDAEPYMLTFGMLLFGLPEAIQNRTLKAFISDFRKGRDVIFRSNDIVPALAQLLTLAEFAARSLRDGISLTAASCRDIEWDGQPI